jgi:hypothetical protein
MERQSCHSDNWICNGNTDINKQLKKKRISVLISLKLQLTITKMNDNMILDRTIARSAKVRVMVHVVNATFNIISALS